MAKCFRIKVYGQHNFVKKPLLYRGKALTKAIYKKIGIMV